MEIIGSNEKALESEEESKTSKINKNSPLYRMALIALFVGSFACFGLEYCVQPIIPIIADTFGLAPATASMAVSAGTGGMSCSMIFIAALARRLPRRKTMSIGLSVAAVLACMVAVCSYFNLILLFRLIQGILLAGFPTMAVAYINEEFAPEIIGTVVGIYVSGTSIGGLIGRLALSAMTDLSDWRTALMILGGIYLLMGVSTWYMLPKEKHDIVHEVNHGVSMQVKKILGDMRHILSNKHLVALYCVAMILMGSFVCTYNFISYILLAPPYNLSQTVMGFVYLLYLVGTVASTAMGMMSDKIGNGKVITFNLAMMATGMLVSLCEPLVFKIIGLGMFTFGFFGGHSSACSWNGRLDKADKAQLTAMYMLFYYFGASVFGSLGGVFLADFGWAGVVGFLVAVLSIGVVLSLWLTRSVSISS